MVKRSFSHKLAIFAAFALIFAFYLVCRCPFKFFFGVPCPGCGMLRATLSLLKLDFSAAFVFHPLVFLMIPVGIYLVFRSLKLFSFKKTTERVLLACIVAVFVAVYVIRLYGGEPVVKMDFQSSVLHKIITLIMGAIAND